MGKASVLLVDGNRDVLKSNAAALEKDGYSALTATTLAEAWRALADNPIRAVVTETVLPDGNGFNFCLKLRDPNSALRTMNSALSRIPVLFLSARSESADILEGYAAGCNCYVTKPYSVNVLVARVEAALR